MFKHYLAPRYIDPAGLDPTPELVTALEDGDFAIWELFRDEVSAGETGDATAKNRDLLGISSQGWGVVAAEAKALRERERMEADPLLQ